MSTLRDVAARVVAEIDNLPVADGASPVTLRNWAATLTAALLADADAPCQCPPDVLEACDAWGFDTLGEADRCTICGRKVKVPK